MVPYLRLAGGSGGGGRLLALMLQRMQRRASGVDHGVDFIAQMELTPMTNGGMMGTYLGTSGPKELLLEDLDEDDDRVDRFGIDVWLYRVEEGSTPPPP
jgi:hypothetical protein